jgi:hypothetical protein
MTIDLKAVRALCEADAKPIDPPDMHEMLRRDRILANAARTLLPEALDEVERLRKELAAWREKQPLLDRLADLLSVCEGVDPLRVAVTEIERLWAVDRQSIEALKTRTRRNQEEVDRWLTDP